ncbi:MAG: FliM/FliN family flagellar motor switch protein [Kofleriaceae bacterium]|nr:FliM/FliN family flagellar motor switch protein [Kofleriaceae bacterium]
MSEAQLDAEEVEAIQAAMRESAPRRTSTPAQAEPTRLALIADDRIAEIARPALINLATRAARFASKTLRPNLPGTWQLDIIGAEILDGTLAKEELRGGWIAGLSGADGAELAISAHGGIIDVAAAKRMGAQAPTADPDRPPSQVALRLFEPTGKMIADAWIQSWLDSLGSKLAPSADVGIVSRIIEARTVVRVALAFSGSLTGRAAVYCRPDVLAPRPAALAAFKANAEKIANALANVPVEIIVELGTLRMKLKELRSLEPGAQFTLRGFVDSRVPVYCEGVLKAWARPVVCRGVLAVQIESIVHGQGTRS